MILYARSSKNSFIFQSTLNCEVLHKNLGFELRWTMPSKDKNCQRESEAGSKNCFIILQLVSKTANDRYLAFGVRSNSDNSKGKKAFNPYINYIVQL